MKQRDFLAVRQRRGKMAEVGEPKACKKCGKMVVPVMTRRLPPMFLQFNHDNRGRLHVHENQATYAAQP